MGAKKDGKADDDPFDDDDYRSTARLDLSDVQAHYAGGAKGTLISNETHERMDSDMPTLALDMSEDEKEDIAKRIAAASKAPAVPKIPRPGAMRPPHPSETKSTLRKSPIENQAIRAKLKEAVDDEVSTRELGELPNVTAADANRYRGNATDLSRSEDDFPTSVLNDIEDETLEPDTLRDAPETLIRDDESEDDEWADVPTTKKKGRMSVDMVEAAVLRAKAMTRRKREGGVSDTELDEEEEEEEEEDETVTEETRRSAQLPNPPGDAEPSPAEADVPMPPSAAVLRNAQTLQSARFDELEDISYEDDDDDDDADQEDNIMTVVRQPAPSTHPLPANRPRRATNRIERRKIRPVAPSLDAEMPTRVTPAIQGVADTVSMVEVAARPVPTTQPLPIMQNYVPPNVGPDPDLEALLMQMKQKRRSSTVTAILIVIALALAAVGVIWSLSV